MSHDILLKKLEHYGIRANALQWFESYLKDRTQYVEVNKCKSELYKTNISVPQGGVLSAILFILFTNDIVIATKKLKFSIYADDTCLIIAIDREEYDEVAKCELKKVMEWFSANCLLLNIDKTDYSYFGPFYTKSYVKGENDLYDLHSAVPKFLYEIEDPNYTGPSAETINKRGEFILYDLHEVTPKLYINEFLISNDDDLILESDNVKYLGLFIDSHLKFEYHINITSSKLSRMIGTFWNCSELDIKTKKVIYHSLVEPYLNYGIVIWASEFAKNIMTEGNYNRIPSNLKKLVVTQNKIVRAMCRKPKFNKKTKEFTKSAPLYEELNILRLKELYLYNLGVLVFDHYHNPDFPELVAEKFTTSSSEISTRSKNLNLTYEVPKYINTYCKPSIAGTMFWNSLPNDIKFLENKNSFKSKLKVYLMSKQADKKS